MIHSIIHVNNTVYSLDRTYADICMMRAQLYCRDNAMSHAVTLSVK